MNKKFLRLFSVVLAFAMLLAIAGCGGSSSTTNTSSSSGSSSSNSSSSNSSSSNSSSSNSSSSGSSSSSSAGDVEIKMGAGHTAGINYQFNVAAANIITEHCDGLTATPIVTTGGTENLGLLGAGELHTGGVTGSGVVEARDGSPNFAFDAIPDLAVLWIAAAVYWQICVPADSDIETFADLEGKRVSLDGLGSGGYTTNTTWLTAIGIDWEEYFDCYYLSSAESLEAMQNGELDAFFYAGGVGGVPLQLAESRTGLKLISLEPDQVEKIVAVSKATTAKTIPAGTYTGIDEEVNTLGSATILTTRISALTDDQAYAIIKALDEHRDELVATNKSFAYGTVEQLVEEYNGVLEIHPGAQRYLREIGVLQ